MNHWVPQVYYCPNKRLLQSRKASGSRASLAVTILAAQQNRRDVRTHTRGLTTVSVYSNPAGGAAEGAAQYISAVLDLLGDQDPLEVLRSSVQCCVERTAGLTQEQLHAAETSGKWSIVGVLQHLADSELVWGYRLRKILAEDRPVLTGFDQDLWANRLGYATADRDEALGLFAALREANLRLLNRASKEELGRVVADQPYG